jgi:hypothetical protein
MFFLCILLDSAQSFALLFANQVFAADSARAAITLAINEV